MTNEEAIEKWATMIIPVVFHAEQELMRTQPTWKKRLKYVLENDAPKVGQEYCRAIEEIIVKTAEDYESDSEEERLLCN